MPVQQAEVLQTDIPPRLDRLPWSGWHVRVVAALGITWLLDGLEGGVGGALSGALKQHETMGFTDAQLGLSSTFYLAGTVVGALVFGYLADRYGRRKLFLWTLAVYVCATTATACSCNLLTFTICRTLTGAGIGGEYSAITSAVDELIPARMRGTVDLVINSTFWIGVVLGSLVAVGFLSPHVFGLRLGWRLAFFAGLPIAVLVLFLRRHIPESPRWLLTHGDPDEAELVTREIEAEVRAHRGSLTRVTTSVSVARGTHNLVRNTLKLFAGRHRSRAWLCLGLMVAQSFFYNSVFFSSTLVLLRFYGVSAQHAGLLFMPIAMTNFLGPGAAEPAGGYGWPASDDCFDLLPHRGDLCGVELPLLCGAAEPDGAGGVVGGGVLLCCVGGGLGVPDDERAVSAAGAGDGDLVFLRGGDVVRWGDGAGGLWVAAEQRGARAAVLRVPGELGGHGVGGGSAGGMGSGGGGQGARGAVSRRMADICRRGHPGLTIETWGTRFPLPAQSATRVR